MVQAMEDGMSQETIFEYTNIDPWFLSQLGELHEAEQWLKTQSLDSISYDDLLATKQRGFSDVQIARCMGMHCPLVFVMQCTVIILSRRTVVLLCLPLYSHQLHNSKIYKLCAVSLVLLAQEMMHAEAVSVRNVLGHWHCLN